MNKIATMIFIVSTVAFAPTPSSADSSSFMGEWVNVDADTRGITRFVVTSGSAPDSLTIQVFGSCTPTECEWGPEAIAIFGAGLADDNYQFGVARYEDKVGVATITMELQDDGRFTLDWYRDYQDSRKNTHWYDIFEKRAEYPRACPDLIIDEIERPKWDGDRRQSVIRAKVKNVGNAPAGESLARLIDSGRLQPSGAPFNSVASVQSLAPGASKKVTFTLPYWVFDPDADFEITADYKNMVRECNEGNNTKGYHVIG